MTEGFITIGSRNTEIQHIAGWLEIQPKVSRLCGHVAYRNGQYLSFSGGLVSNNVSDTEIDEMILAMVTKREQAL